MIHSQLIMKKYQPQLVPEQLYIALLLKYGQRTPYRRLQMMKRSYNADQSRRRREQLWEHYYVKKACRPNTVRSMECVYGSCDEDTQQRLANFRLFLKSLKKEESAMPSLHNSNFMTNSLQLDIRDLFCSPQFRAETSRQECPFPKVAKVTRRKTNIKQIR